MAELFLKENENHGEKKEEGARTAKPLEVIREPRRRVRICGVVLQQFRNTVKNNGDFLDNLRLNLLLMDKLERGNRFQRAFRSTVRADVGAKKPLRVMEHAYPHRGLQRIIDPRVAYYSCATRFSCVVYSWFSL